MEHGQPSKTASAPFDVDEGDIILRAADGVDFHVYKPILSVASPFFKGMFTLKQPTDGEVSGANRAVVDVSEESVVLDAILRWCYPIRAPQIDDITLFSGLFDATVKYGMEEVTNRARQAFRTLIKDFPQYAYALCCRLEFEEEASLAAMHWKATRVYWADHHPDFSQTSAALSFSVEMDGISGGAYFRLLEHLRGGKITKFCACTSDDNESHDSPTLSEKPITAVYPFTLPDTDLIVRSNDGSDFRVHRLILSLQVDLNRANSPHSLLEPSDITADGLPVVIAREDGRTLSEMLKLCYPPPPGATTMIIDWTPKKYRDSLKVISAAQSYGLWSIVRTYRSQFSQHLKHNSLDLYCIAVNLGWTKEARMAAETLATDISEAIGYTAMLESISATQYFRLLSFCHKYRLAMMTRMESATYQGWTDVTQWKEKWFEVVAGRSTRSIPSILVEREVAAARNRRLQYQDGQFDLTSVVTLSRRMEIDIEIAVDEIQL